MSAHEIYSKKQQLLFLALGILIIAATVWTTYLYFSTRHVITAWNETFTTPQEFWAEVPNVKYNRIFTVEK